eukprot:SAG11_NODE_11182_length_778_cov_1.020619_1_plen_183_part_00
MRSRICQAILKSFAAQPWKAVASECTGVGQQWVAEPSSCWPPLPSFRHFYLGASGHLNETSRVAGRVNHHTIHNCACRRVARVFMHYRPGSKPSGVCNRFASCRLITLAHGVLPAGCAASARSRHSSKKTPNCVRSWSSAEVRQTKTMAALAHAARTKIFPGTTRASSASSCYAHSCAISNG